MKVLKINLLALTLIVGLAYAVSSQGTNAILSDADLALIKGGDEGVTGCWDIEEDCECHFNTACEDILCSPCYIFGGPPDQQGPASNTPPMEDWGYCAYFSGPNPYYTIDVCGEGEGACDAEEDWSVTFCTGFLFSKYDEECQGSGTEGTLWIRKCDAPT